MNTGNIIKNLKRVEDLTIIVIGDFCLDKYMYSDPLQDDISVESGMSAWQIYDKKMAAGVAGTITNNLRALGAKVKCVGFAGNDGEGFEMKRELIKVGADINYMITTDELITATYLKTMRKIDGEYKEDIRFDYRNKNAPSKELSDKLLRNFELAIEDADGVVISDQFYEENTGAISDYLKEKLSNLAKEKNIPFLVDSRAFATKFKNIYVKCNNYELMKYCNVDGNPENREDVISGSKNLSAITQSPVFITRNKEGTIIYDGEVSEVLTYPVRGEIDVTGAGDASNAGIIIGLSLGLAPAEAAKLACAVSSITIHKIGETGTATIKEITDLLEQEN